MAAASIDAQSGGYTDEEQWSDEREREFQRERRDRRLAYEERMNDGSWCKCGSCFPVGFAKTVFDLCCCAEETQSDQLISLRQDAVKGDRTEPYKCITEHPAFHYLCLYERGLTNFQHVYRMSEFDSSSRDSNSRSRYVAYRRYSNWVHGRLGYKIRREIPQCVAKKIREAFPSDTPDDHRGFELADQ